MESWQADGATDIYSRAAEKARTILTAHRPQPLPEKAAADIRTIISETEGELGVGAA
jgi:trimethylamine--corrinoid protein Co-methyltransferase